MKEHARIHSGRFDTAHLSCDLVLAHMNKHVTPKAFLLSWHKCQIQPEAISPRSRISRPPESSAIITSCIDCWSRITTCKGTTSGSGCQSWHAFPSLRSTSPGRCPRMQLTRLAAMHAHPPPNPPPPSSPCLILHCSPLFPFPLAWAYIHNARSLAAHWLLRPVHLRSHIYSCLISCCRVLFAWGAIFQVHDQDLNANVF